MIRAFSPNTTWLRPKAGAAFGGRVVVVVVVVVVVSGMGAAEVGAVVVEVAGGRVVSSGNVSEVELDSPLPLQAASISTRVRTALYIAAAYTDLGFAHGPSGCSATAAQLPQDCT
jgi:hypothetical protein